MSRVNRQKYHPKQAARQVHGYDAETERLQIDRQPIRTANKQTQNEADTHADSRTDNRPYNQTYIEGGISKRALNRTTHKHTQNIDPDSSTNVCLVSRSVLGPPAPAHPPACSPGGFPGLGPSGTGGCWSRQTVGPRAF